MLWPQEIIMTDREVQRPNQLQSLDKKRPGLPNVVPEKCGGERYSNGMNMAVIMARL